jgi:hypothetical protein
MKKRLVTALAAYTILGVIAWFVLEGNFRFVVLILFGLFAVRSVIAVKGGLVISRDEPPISDSDSELEHPDH